MIKFKDETEITQKEFEETMKWVFDNLVKAIKNEQKSND